MTDEEFLSKCTPAEVVMVSGEPGAHVFSFDDVEANPFTRFTRVLSDAAEPDASDLAAWLLEQIAEDERVASQVGLGVTYALNVDPGTEVADDAWKLEGEPRFLAHTVSWNPMRVLAECDAKRRIVRIHAGGEHLCPSREAVDDGLWSVTDQDVMKPCPTLRLMALPYADRPGYRAEWRPDTPR